MSESRFLNLPDGGYRFKPNYYRDSYGPTVYYIINNREVAYKSDGCDHYVNVDRPWYDTEVPNLEKVCEIPDDLRDFLFEPNDDFRARGELQYQLQFFGLLAKLISAIMRKDECETRRILRECSSFSRKLKGLLLDEQITGIVLTCQVCIMHTLLDVRNKWDLIFMNFQELERIANEIELEY